MTISCCSTEKPCRISRCLCMGALIIIGLAALGWVVMMLWNWLMPSLFTGAQSVNYCQALGILLLSKILFGSWRCCKSKNKCCCSRNESLTPEEREQVKSRFSSRWGNWCCSSSSDDAAKKDETPKA